MFIDPDKCVFDFFAILRGLMDAYIDGKLVFAGRRSETQNEWAGICGLDECNGFSGRRSDVVGCFGEEQGLDWELGDQSGLTACFYYGLGEARKGSSVWIGYGTNFCTSSGGFLHKQAALGEVVGHAGSGTNLTNSLIAWLSILSRLPPKNTAYSNCHYDSILDAIWSSKCQ